MAKRLTRHIHLAGDRMKQCHVRGVLLWDHGFVAVNLHTHTHTRMIVFI